MHKRSSFLLFDAFTPYTGHPTARKHVISQEAMVCFGWLAFVMQQTHSTWSLWTNNILENLIAIQTDQVWRTWIKSISVWGYCFSISGSAQTLFTRRCMYTHYCTLHCVMESSVGSAHGEQTNIISTSHSWSQALTAAEALSIQFCTRPIALCLLSSSMSNHLVRSWIGMIMFIQNLCWNCDLCTTWSSEYVVSIKKEKKVQAFKVKKADHSQRGFGLNSL